MTVNEIKQEMLSALSSLKEEDRQKCIDEIELISKSINLDGALVIEKFYSQWKSGKKGKHNDNNSWLGYFLGLTSKKPDESSNAFARRMALVRPTPPDIDTDFQHDRRAEVVDHEVEKFGRSSVSNIGTYGSLKMRSAITRIIKTLDIANAFDDGKQEYKTRNVEKANEILSKLPPNRGAFLKVNDENGYEVTLNTTKDVMQVKSRACDDFKYYMEKYPDIYKHALHIEGLPQIFGVHASGICISGVPLHDICPLRPAKETNEVDAKVSLATQFAFEDLEYLGLVKFDFLGISTLTVIAECLKLIKTNFEIDIDLDALPMDAKLSIEAKKTYDLYRSGELLGVFQCDKAGMQKVCVDVGVDSFDDIVAIIALYRPGPMDNIKDYCDRKHGREPIDYFHPTIKPYVEHILKDTYGISVYQESLMLICNSLAKMSIGEGYGLIKGVSKKKIDDIRKYQQIFISGCISNGVPSDVAQQYWDKIVVPFAEYGFNRSHSTAYGLLSYATAYLKANFPEEFMLAYLNVETKRKKWDRVAQLENEAIRMGMRVLPRDINKCGHNWELYRRKDPSNGISSSEIRPTLCCKDLSLAAADDIIKNRPYQNIRELAGKTDTKIVNTKTVDALCEAKFFKTKKDKLVTEFATIREDLKKLRAKGRVSQNILED